MNETVSTISTISPISTHIIFDHPWTQFIVSLPLLIGSYYDDLRHHVHTYYDYLSYAVHGIFALFENVSQGFDQLLGWFDSSYKVIFGAYEFVANSFISSYVFLTNLYATTYWFVWNSWESAYSSLTHWATSLVEGWTAGVHALQTHIIQLTTHVTDTIAHYFYTSLTSLYIWITSPLESLYPLWQSFEFRLPPLPFANQISQHLEPVYDWSIDHWKHILYVYSDDPIAQVCGILLVLIVLTSVILYLKRLISAQATATGTLLAPDTILMRQLIFIPLMLKDPVVELPQLIHFNQEDSHSLVPIIPLTGHKMTCQVSQGISEGEFMILHNNSNQGNVNIELGTTIAKGNDNQSIMKLDPGQGGLYLWMGSYWLTATSGYRIWNGLNSV